MQRSQTSRQTYAERERKTQTNRQRQTSIGLCYISRAMFRPHKGNRYCVRLPICSRGALTTDIGGYRRSAYKQTGGVDRWRRRIPRLLAFSGRPLIEAVNKFLGNSRSRGHRSSSQTLLRCHLLGAKRVTRVAIRCFGQLLLIAQPIKAPPSPPRHIILSPHSYILLYYYYIRRWHKYISTFYGGRAYNHTCSSLLKFY